MKSIGCLHAHYSNIEYLEKALASYPVTLHHFIDPGLILRFSKDHTFSAEQARKKVLEQIDWISAINVDAIVITCTNYIAMLGDTSESRIPIIKIDEPFFRAFSQLPSPKKLIFTNPETVEGTVIRLNDYLYQKNKPSNYSIDMISNAFEYLMNGNTKIYNEIICKNLTDLINNNTEENLAVAQLSMVDAGKRIHEEILNPLDPLIDEILLQLHISK